MCEGIGTPWIVLFALGASCASVAAVLLSAILSARANTLLALSVELLDIRRRRHHACASGWESGR